MPAALEIDAAVETWPIAGEFAIARGAKREAVVVVAHVGDGAVVGPRRVRALCALRRDRRQRARRDRCAPATCTIARAAADRCPPAPRATPSTARCGTTKPSAQDQPLPHSRAWTRLRPLDHRLHHQPRRCRRPWRLKRRQAAPTMPLLKIKLGGEGDAERMRQIRAACPQARLIADANEAWTPAMLPELHGGSSRDRLRTDRAAAAGGRGRDAALDIVRAVPVCADEVAAYAPRPCTRWPGATMRSTSSSTRPAD